MKTFLVKKDVNKCNSQDNWIIMNGLEFARFMDTEDGQSRKKNFARLGQCDEHDDAIVVECGEMKAREWERERLRELHHLCANLKYPTISFDYFMPGKEAYCGEDVIADSTVDVAQAAIRLYEIETLHEAIRLLNNREFELIQLMFLSGGLLTEKEYAEHCGICQSSAHERKIRALTKLRDILKNSGFGPDYFD